MKKRKTITLSPEVIDKVESIAKKEKRSFSSTVEIILDNIYDNNNQEKK